MKTTTIALGVAAIAFALSLGAAGRAGRAEAAAPAGCAPADGMSFICGLTNVEDMVVEPGGRWVFGSSYVERGAGLYVIDAQGRTAKPAALSIAPGAGGAPYAGCPAPDLKGLMTHGLELRAGAGGVHTLYAVNHGGRESIEVFSIDARGSEPAIAWIGCIIPPAPMEANGMASLPGGALAITKFRNTTDPITKVFAGEITGATYIWRPGQGFSELPGHRYAGNNGILASPDGKTLFIAEYGRKRVHRISLDGTSPSATVATVAHPDNMHWDRGRILVAQHFLDTVKKPGDPRGWVVEELDPGPMTIRTVVRKAGGPVFDNGTTAVRAADRLWIGVFQGDRVAYLPAP